MIWHRHEIENYLLEPSVVLAAFDSYRISASGGWIARLPSTLDDVAQLMRGFAFQMLEDQAGRLLADALAREESALGNTHIERPAPRPPRGSRHPRATQWKNSLRRELERIHSVNASVAAWSKTRSRQIDAAYDQTLAGLRNARVVESGDFLFEMDGKELLKSLVHYLRVDAEADRISDDILIDELVKVLPQAIGQSGFSGVDDFALLAARIKAAVV